VFSDTLKEHNAAVSNWRKVEREMRAKKEAEAKAAGVSTELPLTSTKGTIAGAAATPAPKRAARQAAGAMAVPLPVRKPRH
jgi:UPF0755 protein